ncbi:hypothetical protein BU24DRAFT_267015 [Aaosphaeria arxii CBS 175.79]|uniref:Uncharacterized protein n=1 Tax=Aaosphaeria arxii CBS 175.79 TaxID=1450172 RepID=A0A6A5XGJ4_9PLEO|nr:uncharacterized protein BU24DRAFT_267015 [Aaosphaeria arxii CBS 175.79]KAF2011957.1 hypothetical protein BU24DRAFT_267015 [Aaosphaeria arxii CBS 175.79]
MESSSIFSRSFWSRVEVGEPIETSQFQSFHLFLISYYQGLFAAVYCHQHLLIIAVPGLLLISSLFVLLQALDIIDEGTWTFPDNFEELQNGAILFAGLVFIAIPIAIYIASRLEEMPTEAPDQRETKPNLTHETHPLRLCSSTTVPLQAPLLIQKNKW